MMKRYDLSLQCGREAVVDRVVVLESDHLSELTRIEEEHGREVVQKNTVISGLVYRYNDLEEECAWEINALRAERDELRDALDTIEGMATDTSVDIQGIARKALNKQAEDGRG